MDPEPEEPLSPQEVEERHRKVERIKTILAKSRYLKYDSLACKQQILELKEGLVAFQTAC